MIKGLQKKKERRKKVLPNVEVRTLTVRLLCIANMAPVTASQACEGMFLVDLGYSAVFIRAYTACTNTNLGLCRDRLVLCQYPSRSTLQE